MSFTMAVIADMHLPAVAGTAQEACLDWALAALTACPPDVLAVAGDVTAAGSVAAATTVRSKLDRCGLNVLITPGNSDLRSVSQRAPVLQALASPLLTDHPACRVVLLDTSEGQITSEARLAVAAAAREAGDRALAVVTHFPPDLLSPDSQQWCEAWVRRARPSLIVAAHAHRDRPYDWGGAPVHMVRGLDPDKAIGGPPAVAAFDLRDGVWRRSDLTFPGGAVAGWSQQEREDLGSLLGLACSDEATGGLRLAAEVGVACVELRATAAAAEAQALGEALAQWRAAGGRTLSWHMPDVPWRADGADPAAVATWQGLLRLGLHSGIQAVTVHGPGAPVELMQPGAVAWRGFSDAYCWLLEPAAARGVRVAIENLHMHAGEAPDDSRRFAYLPSECLAWVEELRSRLGEETVGLVLDLGHARNNDPFASELTLGAWYALVGRHAAAYHVHQVVVKDGGMLNHQPLTGLYGPLISLSSFLWAWHAGQLNHAPVFMEVPGAEGQRTSLRALRHGLGL